MNAKGQSLRPSPAWEALPPGSNLGSSCMGNLGGDPRTARPLLLADGSSARRGAFGVSRSILACCERTRGRVIPSQRCLGVSTASWRKLDGSSPPQERLRTGPGATDNAGKVIPARSVMAPLFFFEVAGRIRPPLERLAGVLQSKLVPPVSG